MNISEICSTFFHICHAIYRTPQQIMSRILHPTNVKKEIELDRIEKESGIFSLSCGPSTDSRPNSACSFSPCDADELMEMSEENKKLKAQNEVLLDLIKSFCQAKCSAESVATQVNVAKVTVATVATQVNRPNASVSIQTNDSSIIPGIHPCREQAQHSNPVTHVNRTEYHRPDNNQTYPAYHDPVVIEKPHRYNYEYGDHDDFSGANADAEHDVDCTPNLEYYANHNTDVRSEGFVRHAPVVQAVAADAPVTSHNKPAYAEPANDDRPFPFSGSYQHHHSVKQEPSQHFEENKSANIIQNLSIQHVQPHILKYVKTPFFPSRGLIFQEFWKITIENMSIKQIPCRVQPFYIKRHLRGQARKLVNNTTDIGEIKKILTIRYGNDIQLMERIRNAHVRLGKIPDLSLGSKELHKITQKHLTLIKQAQLVSSDIWNCMNWYGTRYASTLRDILPMEIRWKLMQLDEDKLNTNSIIDTIQKLFEFGLGRSQPDTKLL